MHNHYPYKYPHTHYRHNDPLEAIKQLNTAVVRIEQYLKWLTKTTNEDTSRLIANLQHLVDKITDFIPKYVEALQWEHRSELDYKTQIEKSINSLFVIIGKITDKEDGLIKCIEDTLKMHKDRLDDHDRILDDHERRIKDLEDLIDGLEVDIDFTNGFRKELLSSVSVVDSNINVKFYESRYYDINELANTFETYAEDMGTDCVLCYPNGWFATAGEADKFQAWHDPSQLKNSSGTIVPNTYVMPVLGEISEKAGSFSIQVQCNNDTTVSSKPSYSFSNYYPVGLFKSNAINLNSSQWPYLAHGDGTIRKSVWLLMYFDPLSDYGKILSKPDCIISTQQGGVTVWNFGYYELAAGTYPPMIGDLTLFKERGDIPCSWPVSHKVTKLTNNVIAFQCNSINDGYNLQFNRSAINAKGETTNQAQKYIGCGGTCAFNVIVNAYSASAAAEARNGG